jgi:tetratricopeptide (TPR) repeat protein
MSRPSPVGRQPGQLVPYAMRLVPVLEWVGSDMEGKSDKSLGDHLMNASPSKRRRRSCHRTPLARVVLLALAITLTVSLPGCSATSREKKAERVYREACRKLLATPPWRDPFRPQGYIYSRPQRPWAAIKLLERARDLDPDNARYRLLLWWILPGTDPAKAVEAAWLEEAQGPEAASYQQALASRLLRRGGSQAFDRALELLERARRLEPDNALIDYQMAGMQVLAGDLEAAYDLVESGNRKKKATVHGLYLDEVAAAERPIAAFGATTTTLAAPFSTIVEALTAPTPGPTLPGAGTGKSYALTLAESGNLDAAIRVCDEAVTMCNVRAATWPRRQMHRPVDALQARTIAYASKAEFLRRAGKRKEADEARAKSQADAGLLGTFNRNGWQPIAASGMGIDDIAQLLGRPRRSAAAFVALPILVLGPLLAVLVLLAATFWWTGAKIKSGFGIASTAAGLALVALIVKFALVFLGGWNPYVSSLEREAARSEAQWTVQAIEMILPSGADHTSDAE